MKNKLIVISLVITLFFTGCTSKNPSVRTGAIVGGTTGVIMGGFLGLLGGAGSHGGNESGAYKGALLGAIIVGNLGMLLGSGIGYAFSPSDEEEMRENISSQKLDLVPSIHTN